MNHILINKVTKNQVRLNIPRFKAGDLLRVHVRVVEDKSKERIQVFEGTCIAIKHSKIGRSFTVRKTSYGIGVERVFSLNSPTISKIEVVKSGIVRRAKLYYLRNCHGNKAKLRYHKITK